MWSPPAGYRNAPGIKFKTSGGADKAYFQLPDYDLLLTILSILKWRQLNGPIRLYGDSVVISLFAELGILELWDDYNTEVLDSIDGSSINPSLFWAAGKFFAYLNEKTPCVSLDTDMVVWRNLNRFYAGFDLRFTHWEAVKGLIWYCRRKNLKRPPSYSFKRAWNWGQTMAANAAIVYFGHQAFKDYYAREAIRYMTNNSLGLTFSDDVRPELLFAEQRLLTMCAREMNLVAQPFLRAIWSPERLWFTKHDERFSEWIFFQLNNQPLFTHAWLYKRYIKDNLEARRNYCRDLVRAIMFEFPDQARLLENIEGMQDYLPG